MHDDASPPAVGRRAFLAGAVGATGAATAATTVAAEEDTDENGGVEEIEIGDNYFDPDYLEIEPGTTVRWVWVGDILHNVEPTGQPDDANWEGHTDLIDEGEYEHTFEVLGTYEYTCTPHPGMDGVIEVVEEVADAPAEPIGPLVPDEAFTLAIGTGFALVATLGFAYVFLKYGSGTPPDE